MEGVKIGILYIGLHNNLVRNHGVNGIISRKEFFCKLGRQSDVPKNARHLVLKEMEEKKLIERVNRDSIRILSFEINLEEDYKKLYELAGIY